MRSTRPATGPAITVLPNGVDLDYFTPGQEVREPGTIVFSGKLSYHANETAVRHLLTDVMPRSLGRPDLACASFSSARIRRATSAGWSSDWPATVS